MIRAFFMRVSLCVVAFFVRISLCAVVFCGRVSLRVVAFCGRVFLCAVLAVFAVSLVSCATNFKDTKAAISGTDQNIQGARDQFTAPIPSVLESPAYYVDTKPTHLQKMPAWAQRNVILTADQMPFNLLVNRMLRTTPATVSYENNMEITRPITLRYSGTIAGALEQLAANTNYVYQVSGDKVMWNDFVTKTFNISFMPGASNYLVGQTGSGSAGSSSSDSGNIVAVKGNLGGQQFSNMQGKLSIWEDLQKGLDNLKSADGKVWVSEATTTVTVKDHPENVRDMTRYINELNQIMAEQVSIRVQVFELDLNKEHAYGLDWNQLMGSIKGTDLLFSGGGAAAAVVGSNVAGGTSALSSLTINTKNGRGTAILNALATQGKLSVVTEPTLVTMNNQVAEVRITKDTGYLQSLTATSAGLGSAEQSLTPGIVTDGFSLYLLPKIQGDDIYLQISSSLSTLTKLEKISSAPTNSGSEKDEQRAAQEGFEAIQVPTLQEKHFNQRTVLHTGSTLLISGFQQLRDALNQNGLMGTKIPNGMGDKNNHVQTIVLITPTILRGQTSS